MTAEARLRLLAGRFRDCSRSDLQQMRERLRSEATDDLAAALPALGALLHRLAGSGSTFGFERFSRCLRELQQRLQAGGNENGLSRELILSELAAAEAELLAQPLPEADPELDAARRASIVDQRED